MAVTPVNSEDRLVQATFAQHLERALGWDSIYAWNEETFGSDGTDPPPSEWSTLRLWNEEDRRWPGSATSQKRS